MQTFKSHIPATIKQDGGSTLHVLDAVQAAQTAEDRRTAFPSGL
jgi:hypothetical protein